ncbi:MAG: preprotein translocase subunit SecE [Clostridiaceae bacterium]|jgi:preprotein translocase subunit SecE|nr:preprotein translocase subunit SecE [Clostridiaceae bacterium]
MIGNDNQNKQAPQFIESMKTYFRGVRSEWGKITWPEKQQIVSETFMVIAIIFVFTVAVYLMDIIYKGLFGLLK